MSLFAHDKERVMILALVARMRSAQSDAQRNLIRYRIGLHEPDLIRLAEALRMKHPPNFYPGLIAGDQVKVEYQGKQIVATYMGPDRQVLCPDGTIHTFGLLHPVTSKEQSEC